MSETENDYVATATAEKRLREVLNDRLPQDSSVVDSLTLVLLDGAKIEYLPRKKSVSITLRVPETAPTPKTSGGTSTPPATPADTPALTGGEPAAESATGVAAPADVPPEPVSRGARFGLYEPTVTSNPDYHSDDYFAE